MLSTSGNEITAFSSTLVKSAIFARSLFGSLRSERQIKISGWIPIERNSFTECCVGLVLTSPAGPKNGTSVRWINNARSRPISVPS